MITKVAVDCRMLYMSGIGVYLKNILFHLVEYNEIEWVLFGKKEELNVFTSKENCSIEECNIPIFSFKEYLKFPVDKVNECDLYYSPNFNIPLGIKVPIFSTIHDVVFLDVPGLTSWLGKFVRKLLYYRAMSLSSIVFTVSEFSKSRLRYHLGDDKKVHITYNGLRNDLLNIDRSRLRRVYNFRYLLYIGNLKKHKGLDVLLDAISITEFKLVVIGSISSMKTTDKDVIDRMKKNDKVVIEPYIYDDLKLYSIIANAEYLIQPSRYEGFGIPPLEAMFLYTTPIVSDIEVFKEIYSDLPVIFFQNGNSQHLREIIGSNLHPSINLSEIENRFSYKISANIILNKILNSNL